MSYDIYLHSTKPACHECGRSFPDPDISWCPTYNLTAIFDRALTGEPLPNPDVSESEVVLFRKKTDRPRGLRLLSGRKAAETVTCLQKADEHLNDPKQRATFEALQPANGWGDLNDAIEVIRGLLDLAREYPEYVWEIH